NAREPTSGTVGAPLMILGATLILLLFSVGYTWMTPARAGRRRLLRVRGPRPRGPSRAGHRRDRAAVLPPAHRLDDLLPGRPGGQPARAVDRARGAVVADLRPDDPGGGTAGPPHDRPVRERARPRAGAREPRRGGDRHRGARLRTPPRGPSLQPRRGPLRRSRPRAPVRLPRVLRLRGHSGVPARGEGPAAHHPPRHLHLRAPDRRALRRLVL